MGTHAYFFCLKPDVPTLGELLQWVDNQGYTLRLHAEVFDSEAEETAFLQKFQQSRNWGQVSVADVQGRWIGLVDYVRQGERFFDESIAFYEGRLLRLEATPKRDWVLKHLKSAPLVVDMQLSMGDSDVLPVQAVVMQFFFEQLDAIAYHEGVGAFMRGQETLLKM